MPTCALPRSLIRSSYRASGDGNGGSCVGGDDANCKLFGLSSSTGISTRKEASALHSAVVRNRTWNTVCVRCSKGVTGDTSGRQGREGVTQQDEQDDERVLELELHEAIQAENYSKAASLRDRLRDLHEDNISGVLAANARFYKAFEEGDLASMRKVWSKGENVHCVHPGAGCISGYELVISSWEVMLGPELALPLRIELQNIEVRVKGEFGFVTCLEVVRTPGTSWGKQVATNIFEKQKGAWHICLHHASYTSNS